MSGSDSERESEIEGDCEGRECECECECECGCECAVWDTNSCPGRAPSRMGLSPLAGVWWTCHRHVQCVVVVVVFAVAGTAGVTVSAATPAPAWPQVGHDKFHSGRTTLAGPGTGCLALVNHSTITGAQVRILTWLWKGACRHCRPVSWRVWWWSCGAVCCQPGTSLAVGVDAVFSYSSSYPSPDAEYVTAVNASSGAVLWSQFGGPSSAVGVTVNFGPVVGPDGLVYQVNVAADGQTGVVALDGQTGAPRRVLPYDGSRTTQSWFWGPPVFADNGTMFVTSLPCVEGTATAAACAYCASDGRRCVLA